MCVCMCVCVRVQYVYSLEGCKSKQHAAKGGLRMYVDQGCTFRPGTGINNTFVKPVRVSRKLQGQGKVCNTLNEFKSSYGRP